MNKVKVGVVGVGYLGKYHARWYKTIPSVELIGVYDINPERCHSVASDLWVKAYKNIDEMIDEVNAVSIVVPTKKHYEVASRFLDKKIHCLIEKPISVTYEEAQKLIQKAKENAVVLTVGHIERFNPAVKALEQYNLNPKFIEAHRLSAFNPRGADVAVILDLMIHDIDLCLYFTKSKIKEIHASSVSVICDTADIANARLVFENGAVANLTVSRIALHSMRKIRFFQPLQYYSLDLMNKEVDIYHLCNTDYLNVNQIKGTRIPIPNTNKEVLYIKEHATEEDMLEGELKAFINSILENTQPIVKAEDAAYALKIASEIERISQSFDK